AASMALTAEIICSRYRASAAMASSNCPSLIATPISRSASTSDFRARRNGSTLVTQLDIAAHRLQADPGLIAARRAAARAVQPLSRRVFRDTLRLDTHAVTNIAAEGVDLVVEPALVAGTDRHIAAHCLPLEIGALRQLPLEGCVTRSAADPHFMRRVVQSQIQIAADGTCFDITARAIH